MHRLIAFFALGALVSCTDINTVSRAAAPGEYIPIAAAPPDAPRGTCWDKTETPALVQSVTRDVLVQPAQISSTGTIQAPPVYRSQTQQVIVQDRQVRWFEIVCATTLTPDFTASLQRALAARQLYAAPVTGTWNRATAKAVRQFQKNEQVAARDHAVLTVEGARKLGLIAIRIPGRDSSEPPANET